jgi:glycosyltransferase involved in cell wall biosynthesis
VSAVPRLSIGLAVYNGEPFLPQSIESLLGQRFTDFELIISDNASTDGTAEICRDYVGADRRIRYFRQADNIGATPNHNFVVHRARGELFKWASDDDLYARDLLARCIGALDEHPEAVLANSWTAMIDDTATVTEAEPYPLATADPHAPSRFRSVLYGGKGADHYGAVIRLDALRRTPLYGSYHWAERVLFAELALAGPFLTLPDWLHFRRDHPGSAYREYRTVRSRCINLDPRRANPLLHPAVRLYAELGLGYLGAVHRAPLGLTQRVECYRALAGWVARGLGPAARRVLLGGSLPLELPSELELPPISVADAVAGQGRQVPDCAAEESLT